MKAKSYDLDFIRNKLLSALHSLPEKVMVPTSTDDHELSLLNVCSQKTKDIKFINDFWDFYRTYQGKEIISLIGMVNAGKSSVGNVLFSKEASKIFQEGDIRETSDAKVEFLNDTLAIVDLPGLGSVEAEDDDLIVSNYVNRANLLIIVMGINKPIPKHLYTFLKSDRIIKSGKIQRVIFLINKTDIYYGASQSFIDEQISSYKKFLYSGNSKFGFQGTNSLFDYAIPLITFSVKNIRNGIEDTNGLFSIISTSLKECEGGQLERTFVDLKQVFNRWKYLKSYQMVLLDKWINLSNKKDRTKGELVRNIVEHASIETKNYVTNFASIAKICRQEFRNLPRPNWFFTTFGITSETHDKIFSDCRDKYKIKGRNSFYDFAINLNASTETILELKLGKKKTIPIPKYKEMNNTVNAYFHAIWDNCNDLYNKGNDYPNYHKGKLNEATGELNKQLNKWVNETYIRQVYAICETQLNETYDQNILNHKKASDALNEFGIEMTLCEASL